MKKLIVAIISFILFSFNVNAQTLINNMEINVNIDNKGDAHVVEAWHYPKQDDEIITKTFYHTESSTIENISIHDSINHEYTKNDKIKGQKYNYLYEDKGKNKILKINTDSDEKIINIEYDIKGIIKSYQDTLGINWYFLNTLSDVNVQTLNIVINNYKPLDENNTGVNLTAKNAEFNFKSGKLVITAKELNSRSKVFLLTTFSDIEYENPIKIDTTFKDYYNRNNPTIINDIKDSLASETLIIIIIILVIIFCAIIVKKFLINNKHNVFDCIKVKNKDELYKSTNDADYNEVVPCGSDLYHIEFILSLFNLTKNRSNIISAVLYKWILLGYATMDEEELIITIKDNLIMSNILDQELYEILKDATKSLRIKKGKLEKYIEENSKEFNEWFYHIYEYSIEKEYVKGNIKIKGRKLIANNNLVLEANEIIGLKKYLLNFNKVSRNIALTQNLYQNLLIASILLGVSGSLSKEIIRKNKDAEVAKSLESFDQIKEALIPLYKIKCNKSNFKKFNPLYIEKGQD